MDIINTNPNPYIANETYIPVDLDWKNLNETIENVLDYWNDYEYIISNAREKVVEMYTYQNVCMYWYNFFANLSGVENE